jgi:hypothetical protein
VTFSLTDADQTWPTLGLLPARAEEALAECRAGRAMCFTGEWGTFALGLYPNENATGLEAFVVLAVAAKRGAFEVAEPHVLRIARDLGATTVAFRSVRRGWERKLRGTAWKPRGNSEFWRPIDERQEESRHPTDARPSA